MIQNSKCVVISHVFRVHKARSYIPSGLYHSCMCACSSQGDKYCYNTTVYFVLGESGFDIVYTVYLSLAVVIADDTDRLTTHIIIYKTADDLFDSSYEKRLFVLTPMVNNWHFLAHKYKSYRPKMLKLVQKVAPPSSLHIG